jgi:deoxycytidylate deaminase
MKNLSKRWKTGFNAACVARNLSNGPTPGKRVGAALFSGSKLLSIGYNNYGQTHPDAATGQHNLNIHAEHMALIKRRHREDVNLIMYVYRETSTGVGCSMPCNNCRKLLIVANINRIRYIDQTGEYVEVKL